MDERRVPYDIEYAIHHMSNSDLYRCAEIFCKITALHLRTGRQHLDAFLELVNEVAAELGDNARPVSNDVWRIACTRYSERQT